MSDTPTGGRRLDDRPDGPNEAGGGPSDHRKAKSRLRRRRAARQVVVGAHAAGKRGTADPAVASPVAHDAPAREGAAYGEAASTEVERREVTGRGPEHGTLASDAPTRSDEEAPTVVAEAEPTLSDASASEDGAPAGATGTDAPRRREVPGPAVLVLAVLLLAALVTTGVLAWKVLQDRAVQDAEEAALDAGGRHVEGVLSFDYRHLDKASERAESALTPSYLKEYRKTTQDEVEPAARELRAVVRANVVEVAVVSSSTDRVDLLMFVNRQVTREGLSGPKIDLERVRVTMEPVGEEWRIAKVDLL